MKKLLFVFLFLALPFTAQAAFPTDYTGWAAGRTITSAWLNIVEYMLGTGPSKGAVHVGSTSTTTAWLAVGSNGKCLTASSTATYGVSWETCSSSGAGISSLNGLTTSTQTFATSGPLLSVSSVGTTHTFTTLATSSLGLVQTVTGNGNVWVTGGLNPAVNFNTLLATGTVTNLLFTNATGTTLNLANVTSTNALLTNVNFTFATGTTLSLTNATSTNGLITNLNFTFATGTTLKLTNTTTTNLSVGSLTGLLKGTNGVVGLTLSTDYVSSTSCGTGLSCSATTGAITITNIGVTSLNGATGTISGLNIYNTTTTVAGISGGVLFATSSSYANNAFTISTTSQTITFNYPKDLDDFAGLATTTGNLIVASSTGWKALAVGANGKVLTASSSAPNGVSWETGSGGAAANATTTEDVSVDCNAPLATTTSGVPQLGGAWYQPLVYGATSTYTPGGWVFSSGTSSAVMCLVHIPFDMNATPNASLFAIFSATTTAVASSTFDISMAVVNPQAGVFNQGQGGLTNLIASSSPIIIPTVAGAATTTTKSFTSPALSAGQELIITVTRYGAATADTQTKADVFMNDMWLRLDHNVN